MSTTERQRPAPSSAPLAQQAAAANHPVNLRTSLHDQVSSLLLSCLWLMGFVTVLMFLLWLTTRFVWSTPPVPLEMLQDVGGGGSGDSVSEEDAEFEEPAADEAADFKEPDPEQSLAMLTDVVNNQIELMETAARRSGTGNGEGNAQGDGRGKGPGGPGTEDGIPAWERWEIRMSGKNMTEYAKQLDFFKIELGVAGGSSNKVDYVSNVSRNTPTVRSGDPKDEKRIRFLQRNGELREADRQLAQKAGVNITKRIVFQFYPKETYDALLALENQKMRPYGIKDVRRTVFGIRPQGAGFEFYVIDQELRVGATPSGT